MFSYVNLLFYFCADYVILSLYCERHLSILSSTPDLLNRDVRVKDSQTIEYNECRKEKTYEKRFKPSA